MTTETLTNQGGVRIAVEGCGHGTLNAIYTGVERASKERGWGGAVDLVIICGDFQAARNAADLNAIRRSTLSRSGTFSKLSV
ncbi:lariat debranching enzyme [Magnaporthiopsis poae ATCC 64411]|uniref:Lariat debranching enzyme n=1 Tax=Magnaporthiopsis poae (strain ATCC 64411 / 73-15) TaxID=644358 RepID=A0A0C4E776_MAGP6|nr:lariat debranching enzyme [Magnaporthiopsis poae ATCC 64411]